MTSNLLTEKRRFRVGLYFLCVLSLFFSYLGICVLTLAFEGNIRLIELIISTKGPSNQSELVQQDEIDPDERRDLETISALQVFEENSFVTSRQIREIVRVTTNINNGIVLNARDYLREKNNLREKLKNIESHPNETVESTSVISNDIEILDEKIINALDLPIYYVKWCSLSQWQVQSNILNILSLGQGRQDGSECEIMSAKDLDNLENIGEASQFLYEKTQYNESISFLHLLTTLVIPALFGLIGGFVRGIIIMMFKNDEDIGFSRIFAGITLGMISATFASAFIDLFGTTTLPSTIVALYLLLGMIGVELLSSVHEFFSKFLSQK